MKKRNLAAVAAASSLFLASGFTNAMPFNFDNMGPYLGAGYGLVKVDGDEDYDREDNATRIYLGTQLGQTFSAEAGYIDFGDYGTSIFTTDIDGYTVGLKAGFPITERFTLYGHGGHVWWQGDISADDNDDVDGSDWFYGAGVSFALTEGWDLRLDYTRFDLDFDRDEIGILADIASFDTEMDYVSLNIQYTF